MGRGAKIQIIPAPGGGAAIPPGIIVMWSGLLVNIPAGWQLCDGLPPTPDLRDRFIKGSAAGVDPGVMGGANTHGHVAHPILVHAGAGVDAHSPHAGAGVDAHSAHAGGAVDAHSAHAGAGVDAHSAHAGSGVDAHSAHAGAAVADHAAKNTGTGSYSAPAAVCNDIPTVYRTHVHQVGAYVHAVTQPGDHANHVFTQANNHANHVFTQPNNHADHVFTQANNHANHVFTQPNNHADHIVTQPGNHANHVVTQPADHAAQAHSVENNEPLYYSLAFIMSL